ncbi:MAG: outer membrane beta-barrel protein [Sphingobacteriaceae bacterium]|nr:outer membrane beta-barrel protein [Sphingobacteriaceae bacterium]
MYSRLVFLLLFFLCGNVFAQTKQVRGTVQDTASTGIISATIKLTGNKDTLLTITDVNGNFTFRSVKSSQFSINVSSIGFTSLSREYSFTDDLLTITIPKIILRENHNELNEIIISGVTPVTVKEDTVQYSAAAYPVPEGSAVEEILKKLPGVVVDKDGNVETEGKKVARIRINGKDFFGGDVQTATQNLPADIIKNIQIIDDYGDEANLTGVKTGEPEKIINITIQPGKNRGSYGNAAVAGGDRERYLGSLSLTNFLEERRLAVQLLSNNINRNGFNFDGGGRGGGARGANFAAGARGGDGFTNTLSGGIDFQNVYKKKISYGGSYSYASTKNTSISNNFSQSFNPLKNSTAIDTTISSGNNNSSLENSDHRFTGSFEYRANKKNYIKISPYFSYNSSSTNNTGLSRTRRGLRYSFNNNTTGNQSLVPNYGTDILFNHSFKKPRRSLTLNSTLNFSSRDQDRDYLRIYDRVDSSRSPVTSNKTIQDQLNDSENENIKSSARASFREPIGKASFLEVSYTWSKSNSQSLKQVFDVNPLTGIEVYNVLQSNDFKYQFYTNRLSLSYSGRTVKYNYTAGVVAQPSSLKGENIVRKVTTSKNNFNVIPTLRFSYNFSKTESLTLNYNGSSFEPNFQQLQPLRDSSNLNNILIGNENLNPEFTHRVSLNYRKTDSNPKSGKLLSANIAFDQVENKIVTSITNDSIGRTTTYINTDGFFGVNGNISYTYPFAQKKYTLTVASVGNYNSSASFIDDFRNNGNTWSIMPRATFRIDLKNIVDVNLAADYRLRKSKTIFEKRQNETESKTLNLSMGGRNFFFKKYTLGYDFTKQLNYGYQSISRNPNLLNIYFERKFLKNNMGTLRLQGYDLFNQNIGINRVVTSSYISDSQSNRLARYFLLSFNMQVRKFSKGAKQPQNPGLSQSVPSAF